MCCEILRLFFEKFGPIIRHHVGVRGFVTESSDSILLCELDTTAIFLYLHGLFMSSIRIDFVFVEYRTNRNDNSFKLGTSTDPVHMWLVCAFSMIHVIDWPRTQVLEIKGGHALPQFSPWPRLCPPSFSRAKNLYIFRSRLRLSQNLLNLSR